MANVNAPFGFRPVKSRTGGNRVHVDYFKVASGAAAIGKGDLMALTSSGFVARETSATGVGPWIGVAAIASSGTTTIGTGGIPYFPVYCDPQTIYEVQGSTAALATTDLNTTVKVNCSTSRDSNTLISKNVLTATAATASNGVRIIRLADRSDNTLAASAILEVLINANNAANNTASV